MWASEFAEPHPPVTDALVREVEALLGVRLPEAYISLMRQRNGGYLEEQLVLVGDEVSPSMRRYISNGYVSMGSIAGLNTAPNAHGSIMETPCMTKEWGLPQGLVLIDGDGHTWVALDYRQSPTNPPVVFLVADTGECVTIARDFATLLQKMIPFEKVYDRAGNLRA